MGPMPPQQMMPGTESWLLEVMTGVVGFVITMALGLCYKLITNHFAHLQESVDDVKGAVEVLDKKFQKHLDWHVDQAKS